MVYLIIARVSFFDKEENHLFGVMDGGGDWAYQLH
jgi:hypothetical protein